MINITQMINYTIVPGKKQCRSNFLSKIIDIYRYILIYI